jgi:hypothetical protein
LLIKELKKISEIILGHNLCTKYVVLIDVVFVLVAIVAAAVRYICGGRMKFEYSALHRN